MSHLSYLCLKHKIKCQLSYLCLRYKIMCLNYVTGVLNIKLHVSIKLRVSQTQNYMSRLSYVCLKHKILSTCFKLSLFILVRSESYFT